jgi:hypothetical protein
MSHPPALDFPRTSRRRMRRAALAGAAAALVAGIALAQSSNAKSPTTQSPDVPSSHVQSAQAEWRGVDRVVAFADVHGAYDELEALLRQSGIVDAADRWAAGRAHVVSLGDLLDRGTDSRRVMDLLMRLQGEAAAAGGGLHVVVGNHEAMNVLGDLRYVARGEYASYVDLEPAGLRTRLRAAWEQQRGAGSGAAFDERFPPGYFGHRAALGPEGRYGRWILGLPVAIVVNDSLFMHGGPSSLLRGMSIAELNLRYRTALVDYQRLAAQLEQAGLLQPGDEFRSRPRLAAERLAARATATAPPSDLDAVVKTFTQAAEQPLLSPDSPNWYRGAALCREASETDVLVPLLEQFGVARVVVGHTPTRDRRVVTRFDARVVKLDAGMNRAAYQGRAAALSIQESKLTVRYVGDGATTTPAAEALFVVPDDIEDAVVAAALEQGTIAVSSPRGPGELNVVVDHAGHRIPAVFLARNEAAARREVAAWRLDRFLGLGLVPATARRQVQGQPGIVQARPATWVTQGDVQRQSLRGGGWCALEPQFQLVYAFDALLGNDARSPETLFFDADEWYAYVTGHDRAFGHGKGLPGYLKRQAPRPGAELRRRIVTLDERTLATVLGELVDAKARRAVLDRRDALLASPAAAATAH